MRVGSTSLLEPNPNPNPTWEELAQCMFDHIPVGVGSEGVIPMTAKELEECLELGMDWSVREGYAWPEDKEHCEEYGRMLNADPSKVSSRAKKRGLPQLGTLGAGNHYAEIQVAPSTLKPFATVSHRRHPKRPPFSFFFLSAGGGGDLRPGGRRQDGCHGQGSSLRHDPLREPGLRTPSRHGRLSGYGEGPPAAGNAGGRADPLLYGRQAMSRDGIKTNDRQLACARIQSKEGTPWRYLFFFLIPQQSGPSCIPQPHPVA